MLEIDIRQYKQDLFKVTAQKSKLLSENAALEKNNTNLNKRVNSKSYKLGHLLLHETRSLSSLLKLPKIIYNIYKNKNPQLQQSKRKKAEHNHNINLATIQLPSKEITPISVSNVKELKIACIMDTFTYSVFEPEAHFHQLTPEDWLTEIASIDPDMLFVESAWRGKDDLWEEKIATLSQELVDIIVYCQKNNITTIFWNKEDPFHFDDFIGTAKYFDYVFTTDRDMTVKYKEVMTHDRVYLLPFACQPKLHNPIEKYERKDAFVFAGAYYKRFKERNKIFESFAENLLLIGDIDIYDRNYNNPKSAFQYPEEYHPFIRGTLEYTEIDKAYKGYRYAINLNSISTSSTMFSRRVFELIASNTLVLSNYSEGVENYFGDLVISTDDGNVLIDKLLKYKEEPLYEKKIKLIALRKVMHKHTAKERLNFIVQKVFNVSLKNESDMISVISYVNSSEELDCIINSFNHQSYDSKELIVVHGNALNVNCAKFKNVRFVPENNNKTIAEAVNQNTIYIAAMVSNDFYATNYLLDLVLATQYCDASVIGKGAFYSVSPDKQLDITNNEQSYKYIEEISARMSIIKKEEVETCLIGQWSKTLLTLQYENKNIFAIDEFNYCKNGGEYKIANINKTIVSDLENINIGYNTLKIRKV